MMPAAVKAQRERHQEHRPLARPHPRFLQHVDVVRDRLDACVGAAAERVRLEKQRHHEEPARLSSQRSSLPDRCMDLRHQCVAMTCDAVRDQREMSETEADEDRREQADRFTHAAQVQVDQQHDDGDGRLELDDLVHRRQQAEQGVNAARSRDGDREHVVDDQRRSRDEARVGADELGRHLVTAATVRKQLDDLVVGQRDHEHGERGCDREVERELADAGPAP